MSSRTVIITGGSGYIGSVLAHYLVSLGYVVVIIDQKPLPVPLRTYKTIFFLYGDYADPLVWQQIVNQFTCAAVIHLAAFIEVGESVLRPADYYDNNVVKLIAMLNLLRQHGVRSITAASSSAVYGNPCVMPIPEDHQRVPLSPYARTKVILEDILLDYHHAYGLNVAVLRFSNVAGGLPEYGLGECHIPESHLIPRLIHAAQRNERFILYGIDHDTPDGTCVRDFVHVYDVARLHGMLLEVWQHTLEKDPLILNVGSGIGTSVKQMIAHIELVMHKSISVEVKSRRPGDAPSIVLDTTAAHQLLGWQPVVSDIATIVTSAWQFHGDDTRALRRVACL